MPRVDKAKNLDESEPAASPYAVRSCEQLAMSSESSSGQLGPMSSHALQADVALGPEPLRAQTPRQS